MTTTQQPQSATDRAAFHDRLHAGNMYGLWELTSQMTAHPEPKALPFMWSWERLVGPIIEASGTAVPLGEERRALQLFNPGLGGQWATTNTLIAAVQLLLPGEVARAHRHTPIAIRWIMEGKGAYTDVGGERLYMSPGDLVLTPSWAWHDHGNSGTEPVVWMDGLDIPLVQSLNAIFFQLYDAPQVPLTQADNASQHLHGHAALSPTWIKERPASSPLMLYSWDTTRTALDSLRAEEGSPYDGVALEYTHPQTGGPVLPTMSCGIQLIRPGERLKSHRHTGSAVYYVQQGEGATVINGQRFDWRKGDIIAVPSWALHEHANSGREDAILFSIQDLPVVKAMNLYREEAYEENGGHQAVTSVFDAEPAVAR